MPLTKQEMDEKLAEHFAFEANDDIEGVLNTLSDDAVHDVIGWPAGPSLTREQITTFYETLFADLDEGSVSCSKRLYGENFLVDESVWEGKAVGRPFGLEGRNRPLNFRLLHIMEFSEEGKISREQVWLDLAAIMQQLPQN